MNQLAFLLDVYGPFAPGQLRILWRDEPRRPDPRLDRLVAQTWERQLNEARRKGVNLFNGQLTRHLRHRVVGGLFEIEVGPTDYANFLATNYDNYARGNELGWDLFSNPIGTSANLLTVDGWLLHGRRNHRVACHPGYVHSFGGGIEFEERRADGTFDAFASIRRELQEELELTAQDLDGITCLGMVRDQQMRQPELIFDAHCRLTRADLEARVRPGDEEHTAVVACRDAAEAIVPFVKGLDLIAPVAVGALVVHGRLRFGDGWYRQACRDLDFDPEAAM